MYKMNKKRKIGNASGKKTNVSNNETSYNCSYFYKNSLKHANYLNYYDYI